MVKSKTMYFTPSNFVIEKLPKLDTWLNPNKDLVVQLLCCYCTHHWFENVGFWEKYFLSLCILEISHMIFLGNYFLQRSYQSLHPTKIYQ